MGLSAAMGAMLGSGAADCTSFGGGIMNTPEKKETSIQKLIICRGLRI